MTGQGKQPDKTYWHIEYDDGNQEDSYVTSPSDVEIMRCRMAAPDASTTLSLMGRHRHRGVGSAGAIPMSTDKIYSPPTDEQLQRFVEVLLASDTRRRGITNIDAAAGARMVMCNPALKESWLKYHRELQMRALGQSR